MVWKYKNDMSEFVKIKYFHNIALLRLSFEYMIGKFSG